ncbi:MAG: TIGR01459 family HAD-type hydrolase [Burkholderiales bacterium]|nr:TIGR01459 family HAD-type hydrolase [Burkholderiales bacterium]
MSAPASPEPARGSGAIRSCAGIAELAPRYDGYIIDQWGVLHDGIRPYPGARECLERLRGLGKRVVILSNSGRRENDNIELMARIGFERGLYDRLISAGEDAREAIEAGTGPFHSRLGRRCYAFTQDGDTGVIDGMSIEPVSSVTDADFLIVLRMDATRRDLAGHEDDLRAGIERGLPMVCANPDLSRVSPQGIIDAAGVLARRYEELGGSVFYHGKPHPAIYRSCLRTLGIDDPRRVLAVGDSIEHDILGASRMNMDSAFIAGGIHCPQLCEAWGKAPSIEAWRRFSAGAISQPDYLLPAFVW